MVALTMNSIDLSLMLLSNKAVLQQPGHTLITQTFFQVLKLFPEIVEGSFARKLGK